MAARIALLIVSHAADLPCALATRAGARSRHAHHHPDRGDDHVARVERACVSIRGTRIGPRDGAELAALGIGTRIVAAKRHKKRADGSAILGEVHRIGAIGWAIF